AVERDARWERRGDVECALVQLGKELRPEPRAEDAADGEDGERPADDRGPMPERPRERRAVGAERRGLERRLLADGATLEEGKREERDQGEREDERAHERGADGVRHRREYPPLEDRKSTRLNS